MITNKLFEIIVGSLCSVDNLNEKENFIHSISCECPLLTNFQSLITNTFMTNNFVENLAWIEAKNFKNKQIHKPI